MSSQDRCPLWQRMQELAALTTLTNEEQQELEAHLNACEQCQRQWEALDGKKMDLLVSEVGRRQAALVQDDLSFLLPGRESGHLGRIGPYEVIRQVGRGGMGVVLEARDVGPRHPVALKFLAPALRHDLEARKRFIREARTAAAVQNPHVIRILAFRSVRGDGIVDIESDKDMDGWPFIVMDYIDGPNLQARLARAGKLELKEVLRIGMQIATGLAAAHAQGVIHRDIKPGNILLRNGVEAVIITDFGLARVLAGTQFTRPGTTMGTPDFMSPEQAAGGKADHLSDLFSLGSVLYNLCTGCLPFEAELPVAVVARIRAPGDNPRPIRELNPAVTDKFAAIVEKLLQKDPARRYQSAGEVAKLLEAHLAEVQSGPSPPLRRRRRRPVFWAVVAALVLGLSAVAAVGVRMLLGDRDSAVAETTPPPKPAGQPKPGAAPPGAEEPQREPGPPERAGGKAEPQGQAGAAFRIQRAGGRAGPAFADLNAAVESASSGDTIEIRGNGPFPCAPVKTAKALTLRAAVGFRPTIEMRRGDVDSNESLIETSGALTLEGLKFRRVGSKETDRYVIKSTNAPVYAVHCVFVLSPKGDCIHSNDSPVCEFRSCAFFSDRGNGVSWHPPTGGRLVVQGCLQTGGSAVHVHYDKPDLKEVQIRLANNTFVGQDTFKVFLNAQPPAGVKDGPRPIEVDVRGNVVDTGSAVCKFTATGSVRARPRKDAESLILQWVGWHEERNLYQPSKRWYLDCWEWQPAKDLASWSTFWGLAKSTSIEQEFHYKGGDVRSKITRRPVDLDPQAFSLVREGAGMEGLGVDAGRVGPGQPYADWRKTSDYQKWRRRTGQARLAGINAVVVVAHQDFWWDDYSALREAFEKEGASVLIASSKRGPARPASRRADPTKHPDIHPDAILSDVAVDKTDVVVVCGGPGITEFTKGTPGGEAIGKLLPELLRARQKKLVAAVGGGVNVLADAGILAGKKAAANAGDVAKLKALQVDARDVPSVVEGNIVTARSARDMSKLLGAISERLSADE